MEAVRKIIDHSSGSLTIDLPAEYSNRKLEVIVIPLDKKKQEEKYDFSSLLGKLEWKGDALEEQKKLRDEWE